mmetsp:Transcript_3500/g.4658  ORF Transcript_3500/g.4658 Transcript_3500/m.4658 type:complete len:104 (-) Transcript_3500:1188-1499(-)
MVASRTRVGSQSLIGYQKNPITYLQRTMMGSRSGYSEVMTSTALDRSLAFAQSEHIKSYRTSGVAHLPSASTQMGTNPMNIVRSVTPRKGFKNKLAAAGKKTV